MEGGGDAYGPTAGDFARRTVCDDASACSGTGRSWEADATRQMLAIARVLEGKSRREAAESYGRDSAASAGMGDPH